MRPFGVARRSAPRWMENEIAREAAAEGIQFLFDELVSVGVFDRRNR